MKNLQVSKKEARLQKTTPMTKLKMMTEAFSIFWIMVLAGFQLMRAVFRLLRLKKAYSSSKKLAEKSKTK
ncbi:hypothetical protein [Weissella ceti]|uniref:hypothetical protein n=1 Tax=Weissella ceti TaxID=759620 RepID=UPI001BCB8B2A|nr:hypothetical protein [Weissella ceti]QVK11681.1 hypothetical protein KHQ31_05510 [Weissella ceti]